VAEKQAGSDERRRRPEPARTGPIRSGPAGKKPSRNSAPSGPEEEEEEAAPPLDAGSTDSEVHRIVADAVKLGYDVIGQNLQQGRAAADRFSAGSYGLHHAKDDVGELSKRLVQLTRDLATVGFDLLAAVVRDPTLHEALKPKPIPKDPPPADEAPARSPVRVGCQVKGNDRASASPFFLSQPEGPSLLTVAGLYSPDRSLPPITRIAFLASDDGSSIIATITVPADQPGGVYSGVVCDDKTHAPLGTLTVRVEG
jgi:hypothetical protein